MPKNTKSNGSKNKKNNNKTRNNNNKNFDSKPKKVERSSRNYIYRWNHSW